MSEPDPDFPAGRQQDWLAQSETAAVQTAQSAAEAGIEESFPPLLIRASAGTGKTYQLTNRLIRLLLAGEQPQRILATTFTRKAAGEIRNRLLLRLAKAAQSDDGALDLAKDLRPPDAGRRERWAELLAEITAAQHRLAIVTIDSFFASIARSFALELGLPLDWRIIEETDDDRLKEAGVSAVWTQAAAGRAKQQEVQVLSGLVQLLDNEGASRAVHRSMLETVKKLYELYQESEASSWNWFVPPPPISAGELAKAETLLAAVEPPLNAKGQPDGRWVKGLRSFRDAAAAGDWEKTTSHTIAEAVRSGSMKYCGKDFPDGLAEAAVLLLRQAEAMLLARHRQRTLAAYELLQRFDSVYSRETLISGALRFDDIKRLLARRAKDISLPELYYRLDARIGHLLLDEFQDTSPDQWRVLDPLAGEILSQSGYERSFFCVGDVKQAIFGWRGGRAELFECLEQHFPVLQNEVLSASWRSSQTVIDLVNTVFLPLADNPAIAANREAVELWLRGFERHSTKRDELAGFVELRTLPDADEENGEAEEEGGGSCGDPIAAAVVQAVRRIRSEAPAADIGILCRKNKLIAGLLAALHAAGIPASGEGGSELLESPAVRGLVSLLRLSDYPGDTAAAFDAAHSPFGEVLGLSLPLESGRLAAISAGLRRRLLDEGIGATLYELVQQAASRLGEVDLRRLLQAVELGYEFDLTPGLRAADFIELLVQRKVEDPAAAWVRVMTVHKSKGLEFDAVLLPELGGSLSKPEPRPNVLVDSDDPLDPPRRITYYPKKLIRGLAPELEELFQAYCSRLFKENLCVLYVALTRAKHAVYMLIPPKTLTRSKKKDGVPEKPRETFAGLLCAALEISETPPDALLYQNGNSRWAETLTQLRRTTKAAGGAPLALKPGRRRFLPRRSPSGLEGGAEHIELRQRLQLSDSAAKRRGVCIHALFECVEWLDEQQPERSALEAAIARSGGTPAVLEEFEAMIMRSGVRELLSRSYYAARELDRLALYREHPFAQREKKHVLTGSVDRLVVGLRGGAPVFAHVIDFKTDRLSGSGEAAAELRAEFYRPQIDAYRRAAAAFTTLPLEGIAASLLFVDYDLHLPAAPV